MNGCKDAWGQWIAHRVSCDVIIFGSVCLRRCWLSCSRGLRSRKVVSVVRDLRESVTVVCFISQCR